MMLSYFTTLLQPRFKGFRQKFPKHLEGWKKIYDSNVSLSFLLLGCKPNVEMKSTRWLTLCDIPFSFLFCFTNQILYIIFSGASERGIAWRLERETWPVSKNGDSAVSATRQGVWGLNLSIAFLAWKFFNVMKWLCGEWKGIWYCQNTIFRIGHIIILWSNLQFDFLAKWTMLTWREWCLILFTDDPCCSGLCYD